MSLRSRSTIVTIAMISTLVASSGCGDDTGGGGGGGGAAEGETCKANEDCKEGLECDLHDDSGTCEEPHED